MLMGGGEGKSLYLKIARYKFVLFPGQWDTLDACVFLPLERDHGFIENNALVIFCKHAHETFHKILLDF